MKPGEQTHKSHSGNLRKFRRLLVKLKRALAEKQDRRAVHALLETMTLPLVMHAVAEFGDEREKQTALFLQWRAMRLRHNRNSPELAGMVVAGRFGSGFALCCPGLSSPNRAVRGWGLEGGMLRRDGKGNRFFRRAARTGANHAAFGDGCRDYAARVTKAQRGLVAAELERLDGLLLRLEIAVTNGAAPPANYDELAACYDKTYRAAEDKFPGITSSLLRKPQTTSTVRIP